MECCGFDRTTQFCSNCGKKLDWEPLEIMLTYRKARVDDLERQLSHMDDSNFQYDQKRPLTETNLSRNKACVAYLETLIESQIKCKVGAV